MPSKRLIATVLVVAALAAAIVVGTSIVGGDDASSAETTVTTQVNTATVVEADLAETISFDGTVGLLDAEPIVAPVAGTLTEIAENNTVVTAGDVAFEIDGTSVPVLIDEGVLYRDLQLGESPVTVQSVATGVVTDPVEVGTQVEQGDVLYHLDGEPVVLLYGDASFSRKLAVPDSTTTTTYASDLQADQTRADLVQAIDDAEQALVDYRADLPSNALLNAIDDLTDLEQAGADADAISDASQRVQSAQDAEADGLEAAEDAVQRANDALVEFEELQLAADLDEAAADANRAVDNLTGNDIRQLEQALFELGYGDSLVVDREYTSATAQAVEEWQREIDAEVTGEVNPAHVVFVPGPATVLDIVDDTSTVGAGTPIVTLSGGELLEGDDVLLLETALADAGIEDAAFVVDEVFDEATLAAVLLWQTATDQEVDGIVSPTDVVVLGESSLVSEVHADAGDRLTLGAPLLSLTSDERFVTVDVPAEEQSVLGVGDEVVIELPDFSETAGVVTEVSTTATELPDGSTFFEATVELVDPSVAADLDEAPVEIIAIESEVVGATAVPVTALIALAEGGYAVEVIDDAGSRLVAVDPGFYADGLVEIAGGNLAVGDVVSVP